MVDANRVNTTPANTTFTSGTSGLVHASSTTGTFSLGQAQTSDIADGAVTAAKIKNYTITPAKNCNNVAYTSGAEYYAWTNVGTSTGDLAYYTGTELVQIENGSVLHVYTSDTGDTIVRNSHITDLYVNGGPTYCYFSPTNTSSTRYSIAQAVYNTSSINIAGVAFGTIAIRSRNATESDGYAPQLLVMFIPRTLTSVTLDNRHYLVYDTICYGIDGKYTTDTSHSAVAYRGYFRVQSLTMTSSMIA